MVGATETGRKLVHDSNAGSDKLVFRALTELGDALQVQRMPSDAEKAFSNGNFKRGRRAESRADWYVAEKHDIGAAQRDSAFLEHQRDTIDVVRPMRPWFSLRGEQDDFLLLAYFFVSDQQFLVMSTHNLCPHVA